MSINTRVLKLLLKLGFWLPLALCTFLALAPILSEPSLRISDVLLHGVAFIYLTFALGLAFEPIQPWKIGLWMLAYGAFIEIAQNFAPTRSAELADLVVDVAGIGAGLVALTLLKHATLGLLTRVFPS